MNNKNIIYLSIFIVLFFGFIYFFFIQKDKIENYPSRGTDIVAFGDSLVVGVGSSSGNDFTSLLSKKIGKPIINLGISGNTTQDGINRLNELDKYKPKVVILLLGGNDYLKKVPIDTTFNNLSKIIENIQKRGAVVLVLGIRGGLLNDKFDSEFDILVDKYSTAYVPDVLDGLLANSKYMSDAIHPNDLGYAKIAEKVHPVLKDIID